MTGFSRFNVFLCSVLLVGTAFISVSAQAQDAFITTWETTSQDESITIPTAPSDTMYDFTISWGDGTTEQITGNDPDPDHIYGSAGTYTVEITGTFPSIRLNSSSDPESKKLQSIEQWGSIQWETMRAAFSGAENMTYNANDAPNLSNVTDMSFMFDGASSFNGEISGWDVSSVTDMGAMFQGATSFNQDINGWDVSNVTDMSSMFNDANSFNQDIGTWETGNVTNMRNTFADASSFDQDISGWNVSNVADMETMFQRATSFNQDICGWDVSSVTDMSRMFDGADSFNQDISQWDVSNVTNMERMFFLATSFNQDLSSWDVSSVTDMGGMFQDVELSSPNYNSLLIGWEQLNLNEGVSFGAGQSQYTEAAAEARQSIIDTYGWSISDGGLNQSPTADFTFSPGHPEVGQAVTFDGSGSSDPDGTIEAYRWDLGDDGTVDFSEQVPPPFVYQEPGDKLVTLTVEDGNGATGDTTRTISVHPPAFITTWETTSSGESITIPTAPSLSNYNFEVDWGDGPVETITGEDPDPSHTYDEAGTYSVEITGSFPRITFDDEVSEANAEKLQAIDQWGSIQWESMAFAFRGAENMTYDATDTPDLSSVTSMIAMFSGASSFDGDIGEWDVSGVERMIDMFQGASSFNGAIGSWDVSSVTDTGGMFRGGSNFDQDVSSWDVSNVTDMGNMFRGASSFNREIGDWNVSSVTNMQFMFSEATSFNQDISSWNVSNVTDFGGFLRNAGVSPSNYDALLIGWEQLNLSDGVDFDAGQSQYTDAAAEARQSIVDTYDWSISDGGLKNPPTASFTFDPAVPDEGMAVTFDGSASSDPNGTLETYEWDFGDGSSGSGPEPTHTYEESGTYVVGLTVSDNNGVVSEESTSEVRVRPIQIPVEASQSYLSADQKEDYRLVALPGLPDTTLSETIDGSDWRGFREVGRSGDQAYSRAECSGECGFGAGNGFWLIAGQSWQVVGSVKSVQLNEEGTIPIGLRDGWNIVSNPLGVDVEASAVQDASGTTQPFWQWDGEWGRGQTFESAASGQAYYFRDDKISLLTVPYPTGNGNGMEQTKTDSAGSEAEALRLSVIRDTEPVTSVEVGTRPEAREGLDRFDQYGPPGYFGNATLRLIHDTGAQQTALAAEYCPSGDEGQSFAVRLQAPPDTALTLRASNLSAFGEKKAFLVEESTGEIHDLRASATATVVPRTRESHYRLLVGSKDYVEQKREEVRPEEVTLLPNYPNPFRERTTIEYSLPKANEVRLAVYDVLGRQVAVLEKGQREAGFHHVQWEAGQNLSSGTYFLRLDVGNQTRAQRLSVVR